MFSFLGSFVFDVAYFVATLALGSRPRQRGLQGYGARERKPGSQGKDIARLRAKRKPESHSHITGV